MDFIQVSKARVHNLKSVDITIPRNALTVITGPSGSGKSSLAFDTIYAEGQRRYIESLSSYARQFIGQIDPPDVESITGLSPAIAIDQKSTTKNPRSTVGTITEVYDYLRLLFARLATAYCPETGDPVSKQTTDQMIQRILSFPQNSKIQILSPIIRFRKGEHKDEFSKYIALGYSKVRVNGEITELDDSLTLPKNKHNNVELIIDRFINKEGIRSRVADSVEHALRLGSGFMLALVDEKEHFFSEKNFSFKINKSYPDLEPRLFSFNSPVGACPECNGLGVTKKFDIENMIIDDSLSILDGALSPLKKSSFLFQMIKCIADEESVNLTIPYKKLPAKFKSILLSGSDKVYDYRFKSENSSFHFKKEFPGIEAWLEKKYHESESDKVRLDLEEFMVIKKCPSCNGHKLNPFALAAKIKDKNIMEICDLSLRDCALFFDRLTFSGSQAVIAQKILKEIRDRLRFLNNVGLDYLTLNRDAMTLSGGESQRIRLATQIGSALSGVLYVLDEPSIGLHQRDNQKLIQTLIDLKNLGNTVLVVEHDEETMTSADHIIDMGPGAGLYGGEVVFSGTVDDIKKSHCLTGRFLAGKEKISIPEKRKILTDNIFLKQARENNLKSIDFKLPLGGFVCLTGVSGSGKSTLVHHVLIPAIQNVLNKNSPRKHNFHSISGVDKIESLIQLDQSPIGRTPHSNPATYTGLFDDIRNIFANTNESKVRGYKPGRFSFNVKGGRCETCEGNGVLKIEMHFLPDVYVNCHSCLGKRYNQETLNVLYRGKSISDVLEMSIEEAVVFFENHPKVSRALNVLNDVGLGYIKLGQPATTLSGGEAQRLKLSRELSKSTKGKCLYVLDEPTTGLHFNDIRILIKALQRLIDKGHSVLVIEHNLDVIKTSDWVIDLGPDGGDKGGEIVAEGTPETVAKINRSLTGQFLKKVLK